MKSMNIITVPDSNGKLTGWLRDKPAVIAQGDNNVEVLKNLIEAYKTIKEEELKNKNL